MKRRARAKHARRVRVAAVAALAIGGLLRAPRAHAYCQLTTVKPSPGELCSSEGKKASWLRSCISYSMTDPGPTLPPLDEMRGVADASFGSWGAVTCNGRPIGFSLAQTEELAACTVPEYNRMAPNANTIAFLSDWSSYEMSADAFGLTVVQLSPDTGEIFGADMVLNEDLGPLVICGETCPPDAVDVQNVMTHEAGHFLGLGHSMDFDATMSPTASPGDTDKRSLSPDDIAAICSIYGKRPAPSCKTSDYTPNHGFSPECSPPPLPTSSRLCTLSALPTEPTPRAALALACIGWLAACAALRRRRAKRIGTRALSAENAPRTA